MTKVITSVEDLFDSIIQQKVIEYEFNLEYAPLANIQPIKFTVKGSNDLSFDLNNSHLHLLAMITKADVMSIDVNTVAPINLTLHSMFGEIAVKLNCRNLGDTSQLYPYGPIIKSAQLQQGDPRDSTPMRRLDQGHYGTHGCHRSRWEKCWSERSSRDFREKYRGRAHQSPSRGRFSSRSPNSSKHRSQHKVNAFPKQLCVQVGRSSSKCGARELQAGQPERKSYHSQQHAHQHGQRCAHAASPTTEYEASLFARLNEALVHPREPDVNQL